MKKILISLSIIGVLGAVIIGGTMAAFYDEEVEENVFVAGTLDLRLDGVDGVTGRMTMSNMYPGQEMGAKTIVLSNVGTIDAAELSVTFSNVFDNFYTDDPDLDGPAGNSELDMSREMIVTEWRWGVTDLLEQTQTEDAFINSWIEAADHAGYHDNRISLSELQTHSRNVSLNLLGIDAGARADWVMNIKFDNDAPNELQGDSLTTAITFSLEQTVDQD